MTKKQALEIFANLQSEEFGTLEKCEAIVEVSQMPTHNSVKKSDLVEALRFMAELMYVVVSQGQAEADDHAQ